MRNLVLSLHISLDGYTAGPNGEMDWILIDDSMFDFVKEFTDKADAALYGRKTWEIMEPYWPTAGKQPNATKHEKEHTAWYNAVEKYVVGTAPAKVPPKTSFFGKDFVSKIKQLKSKPGKDIIIFGSTTMANELMKHQLIDDFWLFVNPIILGKGINLYSGFTESVKLNLVSSKPFKIGVTALHYRQGR